MSSSSCILIFPKVPPDPLPPPILYGYKIANFPETLDHIPKTAQCLSIPILIQLDMESKQQFFNCFSAHCWRQFSANHTWKDDDEHSHGMLQQVGFQLFLMGALIIRSSYRVPNRKSYLLAWALPVRPVQGPL